MAASLALGDRGHDDAREDWNKNLDQHPAVIVQPGGATDVAVAVRQAALWSMAVQGTGHGAMLPCDDAMLIDTSKQWFRSHGNENWEFDDAGLVRSRRPEVCDVP